MCTKSTSVTAKAKLRAEIAIHISNDYLSKFARRPAYSGTSTEGKKQHYCSLHMKKEHLALFSKYLAYVGHLTGRHGRFDFFHCIFLSWRIRSADTLYSAAVHAGLIYHHPASGAVECYVNGNPVYPWRHVRQWCFVLRSRLLQPSVPDRNGCLPNIGLGRHGSTVSSSSPCASKAAS